MKFYSYAYLESQIAVIDWLQLALGAGLMAVLVFAAVQYYRNRKDSKYRELIILAVIGILLFTGIKVSDYQNSATAGNQYSQALHFVEYVSKELDVDKSQIYINTAAALDGAIIKVDDRYYRVISGSESDAYLLEKMDLYRPNVELVEADDK